MRTVIVLAAACSILSLAAACTEHVIVKKGSSQPEDETPAMKDPAGVRDDDEEEEPVDPPVPAADPLFVDLGDVEAGTDVSFDVPEGALGFNITAEGKYADFDYEKPFGIERITDPSGKIVHDKFMPKGGTHETSTAQFDTIASASVPQGDGVPENLGGTWKVRFGVRGAPSLKPTLKGKVRIQSSGDGAFHGGKLDLHLHIPNGLRIGNKRIADGTKAQNDPDLEDRIELFFGYTSELLGVERGEVTISGEASSYQEIDDSTGEELMKGFAISKGEKEGSQVLHILMTNTIAMNGKPIAAGIAPGIPGAAMMYGRSVSGIIVTTSPYPEEDVLTMLHEAGHFIGLNHTTEFDDNGADPLRDTPSCPSLSLQNQAGFRECPDKANVMFAAGAIASPVTLSPTQKRIYRGSPIIKAFTGGTMRTKSAHHLPALSRAFRESGSRVMSPVESRLALGFCGLTKIDANALVKQYGREATIAQLRAASADADLKPYIRGRADLALKDLGEFSP